MYNSQYYTCEQIDERLLQGYLDDYNTQTGQSLTKAQFLTKLGSIFSKEGVIDNTATQIGYYECDTAAGTAAKTITVANYALFAGGSMKVKFANKNTANNATLNINSQGAKALYYQGERASATNSWDAEEVVEIYYDGTSYYANNVNGGSGSGVYDVSKEHPTSGPNSDGKFTLEYILNSSNVNELILVNKRYHGMTIQFVSTSDNKYCQFRYLLDYANTTAGNAAFVNITNWAIIPQLVNDLHTDDKQKALTASMGKVVADTLMVLVSENILDPDTIELGKLARGDNGNITTSQSCYGVTPAIKFDTDLICNSTMSTSGAYIVGCVGYADDGVTRVGKASGSNHITLLTKEDKPTWKYVRFNLYPNVSNQYAVYKSSTLPAQFVPYGKPVYKMKDIPDDSVSTAKIKDKAVTNDKADFITVDKGKNWCNPNDPDFKLNYQISSSNGNEYNWAEHGHSGEVGCTGFIPVSENGLILNHYGSIGVTSGMAVYDADKVYIRGSRTGTYTYQEGDAYVRFTFNYGYRNEIQVEEGDTITPYVPYEEPYDILDPEKVRVKLEDRDVINVLNENKYYPDTVQISLPDKIYAVRGDTLQVFYQGIVVTPNIELYDIVITCSVGKGLYRYYQYAVPDNATLGSKDWTITVKDANGNILGSKTCQLVVVDKGQSPSSAKNILCVGDSLTAGGVWPSEMKRRLTGTHGEGTPAALGLTNVNFIGSQSVTPSDLVQVNIEGHSGWSWTDYDDAGRGSTGYRFVLDDIYNVSENDTYTNNGKTYTVTEVNNESGVTTILADSTSGNTITGDTLTKASGSGDAELTFTSGVPEGANPFWNASLQKLDFVNYVENVCNLPEGTAIDFAYFLMTWNGLPSSDDGWVTFMDKVKTVIDALHADFPDCKVKLMAVEFPYPPTFISATTSQNTMASIRRVVKMNEEYQELANSEDTSGESGDAYNTFVEFVNVSSQFDGKYNMTNTERDANTRNSAYKERYTNNSIHPARPGYLQIADVAYRNICSELL